MKTTISSSDDIIDSRDIIERIEDLEATNQSYFDAVEEAKAAYEYHDSDDTKETPEWADLVQAEKALAEWCSSDDAIELEVLRDLAKECEAEASDWIHGETLIARSYFVEYITELIHDCYEMPKEMHSGLWPYSHMIMDYEAAAKEAEQDYISVDFDGVEFLIRSC